jgi:serpin B
MRQAFVPGGADFTRLSPTLGRDLFISFVKQKTFVDVNEVGTEAAAVTAVGVFVTSLPQRTVVRVDRPFVFAIRERLSGTILFIGKIMQPPVA